jgi:DEAD/DEAH box helicase domain-containing protein
MPSGRVVNDPSDWPPLLTELTAALAHAPDQAQVLARRHLPASDGQFSDLPEHLHPDLRSALERTGIHQLYSHQRRSFDEVTAGHDIVVTTSTASGKTLCFNLPIIDAMLRQPEMRALYLYPTKALANDQLAGLRKLTAMLGGRVTAAVFTGDTPRGERDQIASHPPNILIANPDIIHYQQLAYHPAWEQWWASLRFIVLDEAHVYRGVFGSHVAHVLRRIRRIAEHYGSDPVVIAASATIANAGPLLEALVGRAPIEVSEDGAPRPERQIVVWGPRVRRVTPIGPIYESVESTTAELLVASLIAGKSAIAFGRTRVTVERIRRAAEQELRLRGRRDLIPAIASYRAGYDVDRRREIETDLRSGAIRAIVATVALELGIDIGSLDVAILAGYPGSTMGFWQQAGRAGRRGHAALIVMVASQNPLDQYLAEHPDRLVSAAVEDARIDPANPEVAAPHLTCAARELRIRDAADQSFYDTPTLAALSQAEAAGNVVRERRGWVAATGRGRPDEVSLRSLNDHPFALLVRGAAIGDIGERYLAREAHPGAIYLHDGAPYRVRRIDRLARTVILEPSNEGLLTEPVGRRVVIRTDTIEARRLSKVRLEVELIRVRVSDRILGYLQIDETTHRVRGAAIDLAEPLETVFDSVGIRLVSDFAFGGTLHALEHVTRALGSLVVLCDGADLEGHTDLEGEPAAYVFDSTPGGIGLCVSLYERLEEVLDAARNRIAECRCTDGCPSCVQHGRCLTRNDSLDKAGLAFLLGEL